MVLNAKSTTKEMKREERMLKTTARDHIETQVQANSRGHWRWRKGGNLNST